MPGLCELQSKSQTRCFAEAEAHTHLSNPIKARKFIVSELPQFLTHLGPANDNDPLI